MKDQLALTRFWKEAVKTIAEIEQALAYVPDHLKEEAIALAKEKAPRRHISRKLVKSLRKLLGI